MINDFKNQTSQTIFRFLSLLGQEADVYSRRVDNICSTLEKSNAYIYVKGSELVLVLIDYMMKNTREIAELDFCERDKEAKFQDVSTPELAHGNVCRTSPVWKVCQGALSMRELIAPTIAEPLEVHAVLITTSNIINYEELKIAVLWRCDDISMTVLQCCYDFYEQWQIYKLPINDNHLLPGYEYLETYQNELSSEEMREFKSQLDRIFGKEADGEDQQNLDLGLDDDFDFDTYGFDDEEQEENECATTETERSNADIEARIAACTSAEELRRLIVLRAKLAVKRDKIC